MITEEQLTAMEVAYRAAEDSDMGWFDPANRAVYLGLAAAVPALAAEIRRLREGVHELTPEAAKEGNQ